MKMIVESCFSEEYSSQSSFRVAISLILSDNQPINQSIMNCIIKHKIKDAVRSETDQILLYYKFSAVKIYSR